MISYCTWRETKLKSCDWSTARSWTEHKGAFWLTDSVWDDLKRLDLSDLVNAEASWATAWSSRHVPMGPDTVSLPIYTDVTWTTIQSIGEYQWASVRWETRRSKDRSLRNAADASTSATFKAVFLICITRFPIHKTHFRAAAAASSSSSTNRSEGETCLRESSFIQTSTEIPEWLMSSVPLRNNRCSSAVRQSHRTRKGSVGIFLHEQKHLNLISVGGGKCPENNLFHFSAFS